MRLEYSHDREIEKAYIITIKDHPISEELSKRCQESCEDVGMDYEVWSAYDGTGDGITEPEHSKYDSIMNGLKLTNYDMTTRQIACAMSNISLWVHCLKLDKPIVILEHDAIMLRKIESVTSYNALVYLGCCEYVNQGVTIYDIPLYGSKGNNNYFMLRCHAYAIDPQIAKNLICHVLTNGIYDGVDVMMRCDLFNVTHQGIYAYDERGISTIEV